MPEMKTADLIAAFDLFIDTNYFDAPVNERILNELRAASGVPAPVYGRTSGGSVDERVRKVESLIPSAETLEFVRGRLVESMEGVARRFDITLSECENPQFLRYRVGDFFVAHQDGNTGMIRLAQEDRKVSVSIFLNQHSANSEQGTYGGGSLVFSNYRNEPQAQELRLEGQAGMFVAFRSETTHEVTPVTHGERYAIVTWYK